MLRRAAVLAVVLAAAVPPGAAQVVPQPELDNRLVNLPTHKNLSPGTFQAVFLHRFSQPVDDGGFDDLWGLDSAADVGLGVALSLPVIEIELYRSSFLKQWQLAGKAELVRQGAGSPVGVALRVGAGYRSADGIDERWTGFAQAVVARRVRDDLDLFLVPMFASDTPSLADALNLGAGASWHLAETWDLVAEVIPANRDVPEAELAWAIGLNKRVSGHTFLIYLGNSRATTPDLLAGSDLPGGFAADDVRLGFNITRRFPQ